MNPLLAEGELPNIAHLIEEGSHGQLFCWPGTSPPSWTSIATGFTPEKHGIRDHFDWHLRRRPIWYILSEGGLRVGVAGWFKNFPAKRLNGFIIPSWFEERTERNLEERGLADRFPIYYPLSLRGKLKEVVNLSPLSEVPLGHIEVYIEPYDENFIHKTFYLIEKFKPQFLAIGFRGSDIYQHRYWSALEPEYFDIT
jgi:predicted AlkP superfamily pyrophosphatase or phosphodiesterase